MAKGLDHLLNAGIYEIVRADSGRRYVGGSDCPLGRLGTHIRLLRSRKHFNFDLQGDWIDRGERAFEFRVILWCAARDVKLYEDRVLTDDAAKDRSTYNVRVPGMEFSSNHKAALRSVMGTNEYREKQRAAQTGKRRSNETLARMSEAQKLRYARALGKV